MIPSDFDRACEQEISTAYKTFFDRWRALEDGDSNSPLRGCLDIRVEPDPPNVQPFANREEARKALDDLIEKVENTAPTDLRLVEVFKGNLRGCKATLDHLIGDTPRRPQEVVRDIIGVKPVSFSDQQIQALRDVAAAQWVEVCQRHGIPKRYHAFTGTNVKEVLENYPNDPAFTQEVNAQLNSRMTDDMILGVQGIPRDEIVDKKNPAAKLTSGSTTTDSQGIPRRIVNTASVVSQDFGAVVVTNAHEEAHRRGIYALRLDIEAGLLPEYFGRQGVMMQTYVFGEAAAENVSVGSEELLTLQRSIDPDVDFRLAYRKLLNATRANVQQMIWNGVSVDEALAYFIKNVPDDRQVMLDARRNQVNGIAEDLIFSGAYMQGYGLGVPFGRHLEQLPVADRRELVNRASGYRTDPGLMIGMAPQQSGHDSLS